MAEVSYTHKVDHADDPANSYTLGVTDGRNNSATRVGYLYSDTGAVVNLREAAEKVYFGGSGVEPVGPTYPGSTMKLKGVRASRVSPNVVRVTLFYDGRMGVYSNVPSRDRIRSDSGYVTFKTWHTSVKTVPSVESHFDTHGRPAGDKNQPWIGGAPSQARPPEPIYVQVPVQIIRVPAILHYDPTPEVVDLLGTLNADPVSWAEKPREAGSLQFQRFWVEPVTVNGETRYRVEYTFGYKKSLWVTELAPVWNYESAAWEEPQGVGGDGNWYAFIAEVADWNGGDIFTQNT